MPLELINDSVEFARELSLEHDLLLDPKEKSSLSATVLLMNQHLWSIRGKGDMPAILEADEAYLDLPAMPQDVEHVSHTSLMKSRIENPVLQGNVDSFRWVGSAGVSSFGIQVYGVHILEPKELYVPNAFIPVDAVESFNELYPANQAFIISE